MNSTVKILGVSLVGLAVIASAGASYVFFGGAKSGDEIIAGMYDSVEKEYAQLLIEAEKETMRYDLEMGFEGQLNGIVPSASQIEVEMNVVEKVDLYAEVPKLLLQMSAGFAGEMNGMEEDVEGQATFMLEGDTIYAGIEKLEGEMSEETQAMFDMVVKPYVGKWFEVQDENIGKLFGNMKENNLMQLKEGQKFLAASNIWETQNFEKTWNEYSFDVRVNEEKVKALALVANDATWAVMEQNDAYDEAMKSEMKEGYEMIKKEIEETDMTELGFDIGGSVVMNRWTNEFRIDGWIEGQEAYLALNDDGVGHSEKMSEMERNRTFILDVKRNKVLFEMADLSIKRPNFDTLTVTLEKMKNKTEFKIVEIKTEETSNSLTVTLEELKNKTELKIVEMREENAPNITTVTLEELPTKMVLTMIDTRIDDEFVCEYENKEYFCKDENNDELFAGVMTKDRFTFEVKSADIFFLLENGKNGEDEDVVLAKLEIEDYVLDLMAKVNAFEITETAQSVDVEVKIDAYDADTNYVKGKTWMKYAKHDEPLVLEKPEETEKIDFSVLEEQMNGFAAQQNENVLTEEMLRDLQIELQVSSTNEIDLVLYEKLFSGTEPMTEVEMIALLNIMSLTDYYDGDSEALMMDPDYIGALLSVELLIQISDNEYGIPVVESEE
jgi:hypothetical protein